jgi:DnaJ-domain-containing protein 1
VKLSEIVVVLLGLIAGYWVVSKLFFQQAKLTPEKKTPPPEPEKPRWNDILEIPPSATAVEIREAYKRLISKYHPDKVDSLGQELKDLAARKAQEIVAAYQAAMRSRGEVP